GRNFGRPSVMPGVASSRLLPGPRIRTENWHESCFIQRILHRRRRFIMLIGTLKDWTNAYLNGADPSVLLEQQRLACLESDPAWISIATASQLQRQIADLALLKQAHGLEHLPLYGIPFAVKDNIDVAGFRTTAACEAFAYAADSDAFAVRQLRQAGAIVLGKTNLDQFATGLVGTRSPYGVVPNVFDPELISGG